MAVRTLSPLEHFYESLKNDSLNGPKFLVDEEVFIDENIVDWEFRVIKNGTFKELVRITQVVIKSGLAFINCRFHKGVEFRALDSREFNTSINTFNVSLLFSNCSALHITFADLCKLDRGILIENNCKIGLIRFYETAIKNHGFHIRDSEIERTLDISKVKSAIKVSESTIGGAFRVENLEGDVSLIKVIFRSWVKFWACSCKNSFILNYNSFEDTFEIEGCKINRLSSIGDKYQKNVSIENRDTSGNDLETSLDEFYISEADITETYTIDGLGKPIHQIKLPITPKFKGVLRIVNWKIKEFRPSGVNENLKLLISQCAIQRLIAIDFTNNADVSFDRCKGERNILPMEANDAANSTFIVAHSDFGPMRLNEFDFEAFDIIRADNVSFNEIFASNVKWFKDEKLIIGDGKTKNESNFRRRREIYRQLKNALRKTGNYIDALEFQAREMRTYRNEKKVSSNYGVGDKLIMMTNMTNSYGISWLKPFVLLVSISFGYYLLIVPILSDKLTYSPSIKTEDILATISEIWKKKEVFFQLFNPARRFTSVYKIESNDWLYLWDALHRLVTGVLIYQIIRAFRKYYIK